MSFRKFDAEKTVEALGVLLRSHRACIASKLRLLKLLYVADRESLAETGYPIIGSKTVAMDHGPLHSAALNLINGQSISEPLFARYFELCGYMVQMHVDPGVNRLSLYEVEKLQEVCSKYCAHGDIELAHGITHQYPEWKKRYTPGTSTTIEIADILEAVGRGDTLGTVLENLEHERQLNALFGGPSQ